MIDTPPRPAAGPRFADHSPRGDHARRSAGCAVSVDAKPLVLVVDDDPGVRALLIGMLARLGYAVLAAADGAEGVELYRRHAAEVDLVLLDVRMPEMDGPAALAELRRLNPGVTCCFMTGDPARAAGDLAALGARAVLTKPFTAADLLAVLPPRPGA